MRRFLDFLNRNRLAQMIASSVMIAVPAGLFLRLAAQPWPGLDRRKFMCDCVPARGIAHQQQCEAEFPAFEAAKRNDWSIH